MNQDLIDEHWWTTITIDDTNGSGNTLTVWPYDDLEDWDSVSLVVHGSVPDDITWSATELIFRKKDRVYRLLVDGGVHQSNKHDNWRHADDISWANTVVCTHTHVDHIAIIPRLCRHEATQSVLIPQAAVNSAHIAIADTLRIVTKRQRPKRESLDDDRRACLGHVNSLEQTFRSEWRAKRPKKKTRNDHKAGRDSRKGEIDSIMSQLQKDHWWVLVEGKWTFPNQGKRISKRGIKPRQQLMSRLAVLVRRTDPDLQEDHLYNEIEKFVALMKMRGVSLSDILDEYNEFHNEMYKKTHLDHHRAKDIPTGMDKEDIRVRQVIFSLYRDAINQLYDEGVSTIERDCLINSEDVRTFREKLHGIPESDEIDVDQGACKLSFYKTGHLERGSSAAQVTVKVWGKVKRILVTGDIGRDGNEDFPSERELPDYYPAAEAPRHKSDFVVTESTYWDSDHISFQESREALFTEFDSAIDSWGHAFLPVLSQERAFRLFQDISAAIQQGRLDGKKMKICYLGGQTLLNKYLQPFLTGKEWRAIRDMIHEATDEDIRAMMTPSGSWKGNECRILLGSWGFIQPWSTANRMLTNLCHSKAPIHVISTSYHGAPWSIGHRMYTEWEFEDARWETHFIPSHFRLSALSWFSGHAGKSFLMEYADVVWDDESEYYLVHGEEKPRHSFQEAMTAAGKTTHCPNRWEEILLAQAA